MYSRVPNDCSPWTLEIYLVNESHSYTGHTDIQNSLIRKYVDVCMRVYPRTFGLIKSWQATKCVLFFSKYSKYTATLYAVSFFFHIWSGSQYVACSSRTIITQSWDLSEKKNKAFWLFILYKVSGEEKFIENVKQILFYYIEV